MSLMHLPTPTYLLPTPTHLPTLTLLPTPTHLPTAISLARLAHLHPTRQVDGLCVLFTVFLRGQQLGKQSMLHTSQLLRSIYYHSLLGL